MTRKERFFVWLREKLGRQPKGYTTCGIYNSWYDYGCPTKEGDEIVLEMQSGKKAVYELTRVRRNHGLDWHWYDFTFVRYL